MARVRGAWILGLRMFASGIATVAGVSAASAQAWWDSLQIRAARSRGRPAGAVDRQQLAEQRRSGRLPQMARRARRGLWAGVHQRPPVQRARRRPNRHHRPGQAAWHPDRRLRQARRLGWPFAVRQFLPDPQHRPHPARLCRWHQHHRGDRSGADDAACRSSGSNRNSPAARRACGSASSQPTPSSSTANSAPCSCKATGRPSRR